MDWLNYNHLYYFWMVAREGSIARAAEELLLTQPTISVQLKELETSLGQQLFDRKGRSLRLTDAGRIALNYANEIFSLGQEMLNALEHQPLARPLKLSVGIVDVIPKPLARRLLAPALQLSQPLRLICREDKADRLLADLAARRTDMVLSDAPIGTAVQIQGFNHLLGESSVSFFGSEKLAAGLKSGFPKSLNGVPVLLPADHTQLRRSLNLWFDSKRVHPVVAGEFDDSALMFWFGQAGIGVFPAPSIMEAEIQRDLRVKLIGRATSVRERIYAISMQEKLDHPAVLAVCNAARKVMSDL